MTPKLSQICYELKFLDWSILTYIRVFMLALKQRSCWKMRTELKKKNGIIEVPWRFLWTLKLHIFLDGVKTFRRVLPEGWADLTFTGIMTKPGGGAGVALLRVENESSSCGLPALGVPGLCTASHRRGQNLVGAQTTRPLCSRHLGSHLGFAQTGCPVINPSGRVSPGGTTHSAATEQGFRGIWVGRALSDTASLWLTSGTKDFRPSFV